MTAATLPGIDRRTGRPTARLVAAAIFAVAGITVGWIFAAPDVGAVLGLFAAGVLTTLNPVVDREVRERMRRRRTGFLVMLWIALLSLGVGLAYMAVEASVRNTFAFGGFFPGAPGVAVSAAMGRSVFQYSLLLLLAALVFLVPGLAAGAVAGERERRTLALLQVTPMRPVAIVAGKLVASLLFVAVLCIALAPALALPVFLGGVDRSDLARGLLVILLTALLLGAVSVLISSVARSTQAATVTSYALSFVIVIGTAVPFAVDQFRTDYTERPMLVAGWFNPIVALTDAVAPPGKPNPNDTLGFLSTPLGSIEQALEERANSDPNLYPEGPGGVIEVEGMRGGEGVVMVTEVTEVGFGEQVGGTGFLNPGTGTDRALNKIPLWLMYAAICVLVAIGSLLVAARFVRTPRKRL